MTVPTDDLSREEESRVRAEWPSCALLPVSETRPKADMIRMMHTTTGRTTPCRFSAETASRSLPCTPK